MFPENLTFVDIETTGVSLYRDRIIEVAILKVKNKKIINKYSTLVNPGTYLSPYIERITGIQAEWLESAPTFYDIKDDVLALLKDSVFVAHNARFDYSFLKKEFNHLEIDFSAKQLCTVKLFRRLYPGLRHYDLDSLIQYFNFKCKRRHRALNDAKVLFEFYRKVSTGHDKEKLELALKDVLKRPSRPVGLSEKDLEKLPETAGVYVFYGKENTPLYAGKSVNIRNRVLSHFSSDLSHGKELSLSQQVQRVETHITGGELGALLLESVLVKKLQPLYNVKLRQTRKLLLLKREKNPDGYLSATISSQDFIDAGETSSVLGVFKSQKQAKEFLFQKIKENSLCSKIMKLEKMSKSCFSYKLGKCFGACCGKESSLKYNLRFEGAFYETKIKTWPFSGPVSIEEKGLLSRQKEIFIVDKWCLLGHKTWGNIRDDTENLHYAFDLDTYKIISRFLGQPKNLVKVRTLPDLC